MDTMCRTCAGSFPGILPMQQLPVYQYTVILHVQATCSYIHCTCKQHSDQIIIIDNIQYNISYRYYQSQTPDQLVVYVLHGRNGLILKCTFSHCYWILITVFMLIERMIQLPQEKSISGIVCILLVRKRLFVIISTNPISAIVLR